MDALAIPLMQGRSRVATKLRKGRSASRMRPPVCDLSNSYPPYPTKGGIECTKSTVSKAKVGALNDRRSGAEVKHSPGRTLERPPSEFLCLGVSKCLLLGYSTGVMGPFATVLTHKDAQG